MEKETKLVKKKKGPAPVLTEQQIKFAELLIYEAGRKSPAECAFEAGYKTRPRQSASELRNPRVYPLVAAYIKELRQEVQEKYGVNYQSHLQEMARLRDESRKLKQMSPAVTAEKSHRDKCQCSCQGSHKNRTEADPRRFDDRILDRESSVSSSIGKINV